MNLVCAYSAVGAWCTVHFAVFMALRHKLNTEKRIFAFHAAAFAICFAAACYAFQSGMLALSTAAGLVSLQGLYNLTFLWAWSGSEGSYSVSILRQLAESSSTGDKLAGQLAHIGVRKQSGRIQSLLRLRLVREANDLFHLTTTGQFAAVALKSFRWLANLRTAG